MSRNIILALVSSLLLTLSWASYASDSPKDDVRTAVDAIIDILKNDQLGKEEKRAQMSTIIKKRFDFRAMSQRTLATNWKKASDEEQQKFVTLFSKLIESSYVGKLESYTNEKVSYPDEKVKGRKAVVETIILSSGKDIPVDYKMYHKGDEWLVYDVNIEGVSLISNYRSSYQEIMKNEGMDGLLKRMQAKIDELASSNTSSS